MHSDIGDYTQEELFDLWVEDLIDLGYVKEFIRTPDTLSILPAKTYDLVSRKVVYAGTKRERIKTTRKSKTLLNGLTYTPDRVIVWDESAMDLFVEDLLVINAGQGRKTYFLAQPLQIVTGNNEDYVSLIDVKPPPGYGKGYQSAATLPIIQKVLYHFYGIYVNKSVNYPNKRIKFTKPYLWCETFTPSRYLITNKGTKRRLISKWAARTVQDFISL